MLSDIAQKTIQPGRCHGYLSGEMEKDQMNTDLFMRQGVCVTM